MTSDPAARYLASRGARLGRTQRLRALAVSELVDSALRIYRELGPTLLRHTVVPAFFCLTSVAFALNYVAPNLGQTRYGNNVNAQMGEVLLTLAVGLFLGGPLFLIGLTLASAFTVRLVAERLTGHPADAETALEETRRVAPRLLGVAFRQFLVAFGGFGIAVALMMAGGLLSAITGSDTVIGGVVALMGVLGLVLGALQFLYVISVHAIAPAVCVLEQTDARTTAARSKALMKGSAFLVAGSGYVWSLYGLMALVGVLIWGGLQLVVEGFGLRQHLENLFSGLPFQGLLLAVTDLVAPFVMVWLLVPVWATVVTLIYFDRRIRVEGYDIEALGLDARRSGRGNRFDV